MVNGGSIWALMRCHRIYELVQSCCNYHKFKQHIVFLQCLYQWTWKQLWTWLQRKRMMTYQVNLFCSFLHEWDKSWSKCQMVCITDNNDKCDSINEPNLWCFCCRTVCVCALWTKHWCLLIFCLADLVENFDEASKSETNWYFIPSLAVLFVTVILDLLRAFLCLETRLRCNASLVGMWTCQMTSWNNPHRRTHPGVCVCVRACTCGTLLQLRCLAFSRIIQHFGIFPYSYNCCSQMSRYVPFNDPFGFFWDLRERDQWTNRRYYTMWWQLVQCFGVVGLCVWYQSTRR